MFIKICGTTNLSDAQLAVELGADAVGFIFAPSKRRVTVEEVAAITIHLPCTVEKVGVFAEPDGAEIVHTVARAGLTAVQLHTHYDAELMARLAAEFRGAIKLWQVVGFPVDPADPETADREFARLLRAAMLDPKVSVVLLDSVKNGTSGGQGERFSWGRAAPILREVREAVAELSPQDGSTLPKVVLAGGLDAGNVGIAIRFMDPWGVDVVSGVEMSPGHKNPDRLSAFLAAARGAEGVLPG